MRKLHPLFVLILLIPLMYAGDCAREFVSETPTGPEVATNISAHFSFNHIGEFTVQFTNDTDFDGPTPLFLWTFGDGTTSTTPNPLKTYAGECFNGFCEVLLKACGTVDLSDPECSTWKESIPIPASGD